jgi:hypothetical protein
MIACRFMVLNPLSTKQLTAWRSRAFLFCGVAKGGEVVICFQFFEQLIFGITSCQRYSLEDFDFGFMNLERLC